MLKEQSPDEAVEFVRSYISRLQREKVPYKRLVIWKTLAKPVQKYAVKAPHVEAAKTLMKERWDLSLGDKIGYVIVAGPGKLHQKANPYILVSCDDIDVEYYVSNQIVPAASRILSMFGITGEELSASKVTKTPVDYVED